jgi:hypothetical protein
MTVTGDGCMPRNLFFLKYLIELLRESEKVLSRDIDPSLFQ